MSSLSPALLSPSQEAAGPRRHFPGFESVRLLAAAGVIWIHGGYKPLVGLTSFSVAIFTAMAACLAALGALQNPARAFLPYARGRLIRIYLPFLLWSVIYAIFRKAVTHTNEAFVRPAFLIRGGAYHLWFLPFILFATLLAFAAGRLLQRLSKKGQAIPLVMLALATIVITLTAPENPNGGGGLGGLVRWIGGLPWIGVGILSAWAISRQWAPSSRRLAIISLALFVIADCFVVPFPRVMVAATLFLFLSALTCPVTALDGRRTKVSVLAFGLYIVHVFFLDAIARWGSAFLKGEALGSGIVRSLVTLLISLGFASLLYSSRRTRWTIT